MSRIVAGTSGGRRLQTPEGATTRPTTDRVREAFFSVVASWNGTADAPVEHQLEGVGFLDLYAGSGALGFEAVSRGAGFCLFVETDDAARGAIRENADAYGLMGRTRVHRRSATDLGVRPGPIAEAFDLAFLDPPYGKGLGEQTLARLIEGSWLKPGALVVFERGSDEPEIDTPGYQRLDARDYGAARVLFLRAE